MACPGTHNSKGPKNIFFKKVWPGIHCFGVLGNGIGEGGGEDVCHEKEETEAGRRHGSPIEVCDGRKNNNKQHPAVQTHTHPVPVTQGSRSVSYIGWKSWVSQKAESERVALLPATSNYPKTVWLIDVAKSE